MWKANGRTTDAYPWQKLTWPMARWAKNKNFGESPHPIQTTATVIYSFQCVWFFFFHICAFSSILKRILQILNVALRPSIFYPKKLFKVNVSQKILFSYFEELLIGTKLDFFILSHEKNIPPITQLRELTLVSNIVVILNIQI